MLPALIDHGCALHLEQQLAAHVAGPLAGVHQVPQARKEDGKCQSGFQRLSLSSPRTDVTS